MNKEYVTLARAKGNTDMQVLFRHAAEYPGTLITVIALALLYRDAGGRGTDRNGLSWRHRPLPDRRLICGDTTAVMGGTTPVIGICFIFINNVTDMIVRLTDPRVKSLTLLPKIRRSPSALTGTLIILFLLLVALFAPWLALMTGTAKPGAAPAGTGCTTLARNRQLWRDVLSRLIYGTARCLVWSRWWPQSPCPRRVIDRHSGRILRPLGGNDSDALYRYCHVDAAPDPRVCLCCYSRRGLINGALALALTSWPAYARRRSEIRHLRNGDYLASAEMLDPWSASAVGTHSAALSAVSYCPVGAGSRHHYLAAAGLGFLGLGAQPPMAEWGAMIADGMRVIFDQWWIAAVRRGHSDCRYGIQSSG